jgi:hypothetical protein
VAGVGNPPCAEEADTAGQSCGSATSQHPFPGPIDSPSPGVDEQVAGTMLKNTCPALPSFPTPGVAGWPTRLAGNQQQFSSTLPDDLLSSNAVPTWASIVRGRVCKCPAAAPAYSIGNQRALRFQWASRVHLGVCHSSGLQNIYISYSLPSPSSAGIAPAAKCCHHCPCRHDRGTAIAATSPPAPPPAGPLSSYIFKFSACQTYL